MKNDGNINRRIKPRQLTIPHHGRAYQCTHCKKSDLYWTTAMNALFAHVSEVENSFKVKARFKVSSNCSKWTCWLTLLDICPGFIAPVPSFVITSIPFWTYANIKVNSTTNFMNLITDISIQPVISRENFIDIWTYYCKFPVFSFS